jgi:hypothetical protein
MVRLSKQPSHDIVLGCPVAMSKLIEWSGPG